MHYARLDNSPRLQRFANLLADGRRHSTRDVIRATGICAVNSAASELRCNDVQVECEYVGITENGNKIYEYWLDSDPVLAI